MTFNDLKLKPEILQALSKEQYTTPTPIQEQAIPVVLAGRDLFGFAQTGTGNRSGGARHQSRRTEDFAGCPAA